MGVTVFHSLTATTPDNTQYEIKPSNWNSNHFVSLSLAGSDLSGAFANSPTVTFGTSAGSVTASVNTAYVALSNSSSIMPIASSSNFLGTAASGSFIATSVSSSIMPIASSSNFLGSAASGSFIATSNSSRFLQTSQSSVFFQTSQSSVFLQTSQSSVFQQTSATSAITSAAFPSAQTTKFAGTGTTFSGTNVSGSMTLNSNGLNLALSAGAGGGNFSAGISTGGNTSGVTGTVSNQIVFVGGNNVTLSGSTAAGGATVTISGANIGGAQTGISGVAVSNTTYTSGTFSFRDGNNISFASGTGQGVSITHNLQSAGAYLTTAMQSQSSSVFARTGFTSTTTAGTALVGTLNTNGLSLGVPTIITNALTTAMLSNASTAFAGTGFAGTNITGTHNTAGLSLSVPATSSISATGIVSISTNGGTISIGAPAMSVGLSNLGNTSGNTGTVSNQFVLAGGNNITLSGSTNAAGMTVTVSANTAAAANLSVSAGTTSGAFGGITFANSNNVTFGLNNGTITASAPSGGGGGVAIANSQTTYTSGTVSFRDGNGITFASGTGQGVSLTHGLQFTSNTSAITASALNTSQSSLFQHTSATSAITSAAFPSAQTTKFAGTGTTFSGTNVSGSITLNSNGLNLALSAPNVAGAQTGISSIALSGTTYTNGSVSFRDGNNISFSSGTGNAISITHNLQSAGAYLTTAMQSQSSSVFARTGFTSTTTAGTALVGTLNTNGLSLGVPTIITNALTTAMQSNASTAFAGTGSAFTNLTATFNTAGLSISAPATSSISATGAVSISTNGNTISIGAPAFSAGVTTLGNTLGNTGTVSNQLVLAGGNNITLSGSTAAGGMTLTISGPNVGGAQTGISGLVVSNTTYTSGTVSFRDGNGITFASGTGQGVSLTHGLQFTSNTSAITANALNTSQSSLFQQTSATSAITSNALNTSASRVINLIAATNNTGGGTASLSSNISFGNTNGITFYTSAGNVIAANHALQFTSATSAITSAALNTSQSSLFQHTSATSAITSAAFPSAQTTKFAGTGTTFSGTNVSGSITLNSNGLNLALSAPAAAGAQTAISGVVVSNTTYTSGTISFRDGNNISFASGTGQGISITHNLQSANANYLTSQSNQAFSASGGSSTFQTLNFANSNGITFSNSGGSVIASHNGLTSQSNQAFSASGGSSAFQTLNFANSNGLTFSNSGGSVIASYTVPTVPAQTYQPIALSGSNGSSTASTFTFGNLNGLSHYITNGSMVGSYTVPTVPAQTAQTVGFYGSSQTTGQSSSSTFDARSMSFVGAGGISVGASNGSIIFSGATGGGGGGVVFANSQTTYTSGTVSLREGGGAITIASNTGQRIDISVPGVSSLFAVSGVALSSTSNSIYIYNDFHDIFVAQAQGGSLTASGAQNALQFAPMYPVDNYSFTCFEQMLTIPVAQVSSNSYQAALTMSYGLYQMETASSSRMTLIGSSSMFLQASARSTNQTVAYTVNFNGGATSYTKTSGASGVLNQIGGRYIQFRFPFAGTLQAGEVYYLGMAYSHTFTNNSSILRPPSSFGAMPHNVAGLGYVGPDTAIANSTGAMDFMGFSYTATSGAWPSSIATNQTSMNASGFMPYLVFKNII